MGPLKIKIFKKVFSFLLTHLLSDLCVPRIVLCDKNIMVSKAGMILALTELNMVEGDSKQVNYKRTDSDSCYEESKMLM